MLRHRGRLPLRPPRAIRRGGAGFGLAFALWGLLLPGPTASGQQADAPARVALGRLSVSAARPGVGQEVELELPYAGAWPAALDWTGVEHAEGVQARWVARAPGPHRVAVAGVERVLEVQPGANRGVLPPPQVQVRSLPWVSGACEDPRYPRLAGLWVVGCGPSGQVDRALHLADGARVELEAAARAPAVAPGVLYAPTLAHGLWRLPGAAPRLEGVMKVPFGGLGPPGTDGVHGAVTTAEDVQVFLLEGRLREHIAARPAPWYPPAVGAGWVSWVDVGESWMNAEDVFTRAPGATLASPLVRRPGHQRHVAASGTLLGWVEDRRVCVERLPDGERRCVGAQPNPSRGLSLDGAVACWEEGGGEDVDLRCSDGLALRRPGHQRSPSRVGVWLIWREGAQVLVGQLDALTLDDDDLLASPQGPTVPAPDALRGARVEGGVRYTVPLPGGVWRVERHERGVWVQGEPVGPGAEVEVLAPWGDAVRLRWEGPV